MDDTKIRCPKCGEEISVENTLWLVMGKWYCTERCARLAAGLKM